MMREIDSQMRFNELYKLYKEGKIKYAIEMTDDDVGCFLAGLIDRQLIK